MDAKLTGLRIQPNNPSLTSPDQLIQKAQAQQPQAQIQFENLPAIAPDETTTPTTDTKQPTALKTGDVLDKSSLISSGLAGGIAAGAIARDMSTIGESMRSVGVQNSMMELQDRMNNGYSNNSSYGNNSYDSGYGNNSYGSGYGNNNSYDSGYGATEFVRRRGYGSIEFSGGRARIESGGITAPEVKLAAKTLAGGALQGAKYGTMIGGAVSSIVNAYKVITGQEKGADAVGSVAADTITAGLSGAGGAVAGGFATMGLSMIGIAGVPGMAIGAGIGLVGAVGSQLLMQKSGLYDSLKAKVSSLLGGGK